MATGVLQRQQLDVVVVGHVDHGKSTVIGRLLADTGSLPEGKLEEVRARCARSARPFEYAFLLDALKHEQAQGITIDTARCFFRTARRNYIVHDAPGHIEFLKNMATGAARADCALLVIDTLEGVQENSKRHGYILGMLGVRQLAVLINKMDRVDYRFEVYDAIRRQYGQFLAHLSVFPLAYIPISAREGVNLARRGGQTPWYDGPTVLEQLESFSRSGEALDKPFRMPVQDIYKFTEDDDDRRIIAGTVESGLVRVDDTVVFYPSGKRSAVKSIEAFSAPARREVGAGYAAGLTLSTQVYVRPGELLCKAGEPPPVVGSRFRASLFWMGRAPLVRDRTYRLRVGAAAVGVRLAEVRHVLDTTELSSLLHKQEVERHDVAECVLETVRPVAFDPHGELFATGRFVIVDGYEIAGCGVILAPEEARESLFAADLRRREHVWQRGHVSSEQRAARYGHTGKFIVFTGLPDAGKEALAKELERRLFDRGCATYFLGVGHLYAELAEGEHDKSLARDDEITHLGQLARVLADTGLLFITTLAEADDFEIERLRRLVAPHELFVVHVGEAVFARVQPDVTLPSRPDHASALAEIEASLSRHNVLRWDYSI